MALGISAAVLVVVIVIVVIKTMSSRRHHGDDMQRLMEARMQASRVVEPAASPDVVLDPPKEP